MYTEIGLVFMGSLVGSAASILVTMGTLKADFNNVKSELAATNLHLDRMEKRIEAQHRRQEQMDRQQTRFLTYVKITNEKAWYVLSGEDDG